MSFEVGQRFGDYEIVKMLGIGGMGHVYLVRNIISNRTEAMKVLLPDLTAENDLAIRFISEIRTLATFDHPNIAQLRTAFQANNQLIMIMEFVEGSTLEQLAQGRPFTIQEVTDYVSQGLAALSYAHAHGVVHRDIKPANLMVTSHGVVKLMDFGISKSTTENLQHTRPGTTIGSLHYMSPEQVRGGAIDARSDLYSVGVVLYELTAGRRPFDADTTFSILNQQLNVEPTPPIEFNPQLPLELNHIIMTALAKDPANRFQTAEDFRDALKSFRTLNAPAAAVVPAVAAVAAAPAPQPVAPAPIPAAPASAATHALGSSTPPPFAPVPNTAPPPASNYAAAPLQMPQSTSIPPAAIAARSRSNRGVWIASGALIVILALVGLGFALPHFVSAIAGSRNTTPDTAASQPSPANTMSQPTASPTPAPAPLETTTSATPGTIAPVPQPSSSGGAPVVPGNPARSNPMPAPHTGNSQPIYNKGPVTNLPGNSNPAANQQGPQPGESNNLEQAQDRFTQMQGRSNAALRGVGRIRSQQEASGLGMRGDIEAADSRLQSYISAANSAISRGDSAAAERAMDKAEPDLATMEKFLGH